MEGHGCILCFDTDDAEFARGFEAGRLWGLLRSSDDVGELVHVRNAEMVIRMAEATQRSFSAEDAGADWLDIRFGAADVPSAQDG